MIANVTDVHFTVPHAGPAVVAAMRIHPDARESKAVKQAVDRAERAKKPAERAVAEHARQKKHHQDHRFSGEENPQLGEQIRVVRVGKQTPGPLKGSRRADVLAEGRQRQIVRRAVDQRQRDDKHRQDDILQPGKCAGDPALPDLRRRNPVKQLLYQSQGAQPSADGSAQHDPVQQEDPEDIPRRRMLCGRQRVLKRAQGTGADGAGAGIAVEPRHAERLRIPLEQLSVNKPPDVGVVEQRGIQLNQPPGGRHMFFQPGGHLTQVQHTPCTD